MHRLIDLEKEEPTSGEGWPGMLFYDDPDNPGNPFLGIMLPYNVNYDDYRSYSDVAGKLETIFGWINFGYNLAKEKPKPPKYKDTDDPSKTWSGYGYKPLWLEERIENGSKLEDFWIK